MKRQPKRTSFTFLLVLGLAMLPPLKAYGNQACSEDAIKREFGPELDLRKVEEKCEKSEGARDARTTVKDDDGKSHQVSCCAGVRMQMEGQVRAQIRLRMVQCKRNDPALQSCSTQECYEHIASLYQQGQVQADRVADFAKQEQELGRNCQQEMTAMNRCIQEDLAAIQARCRTLSAAACQELLSSSTMARNAGVRPDGRPR